MVNLMRIVGPGALTPGSWNPVPRMRSSSPGDASTVASRGLSLRATVLCIHDGDGALRMASLEVLLVDLLNIVMRKMPCASVDGIPKNSKSSLTCVGATETGGAAPLAVPLQAGKRGLEVCSAGTTQRAYSGGSSLIRTHRTSQAASKPFPLMRASSPGAAGPQTALMTSIARTAH